MSTMFEQAMQLNDADFAVFMEKSKRIEITDVEIDSLAVLKILKHCSENELQHVSGQLLGVGISDTLQISNSYPTIITTEDEEKQYDEDSKYQYQMMDCLQKMNVENNVVGWYQSCYFQNYLDASFIETQYNFQLDYVKKCVCILFDTVQSLSTGMLKMKAIRLTDSFMEVLREAHKTHTNQLTQEILSRLKFDPTDMIEELQITITNSELFSKSLVKDSIIHDDNNPIFIEKLLENIIEHSEMFIQEENKFQYYQRKVTQQKKKTTEDESTAQIAVTGGTSTAPVATTTAPVHLSVGSSASVVAPNRLEALLISTQVKDSIAEIDALVSLSKKKMTVTDKI
eukprot:gene6506-10514_t